MAIAKKHTDLVSGFNNNVSEWHAYFNDNNKQFHNVRQFIYKSTLTEEDIETYDSQERPALDVNIVLPFVSRNLGEFSKQIPDLVVRSQDGSIPDGQVELIESIMRSISICSESDTLSYDVYKDSITGGFSVFEVVTEYKDETTYDQVIKIRKPSDPTLCGFDPLAEKTDKSDGSYCFKLTPKTKKDFEGEYPSVDISQISYNRTGGSGVDWFFKSGDKEVIYICDYYHKKLVKKPLWLISNPEDSTNPLSVTPDEYSKIIENWESMGRIEQEPIVLKKSKRDCYEIWRYRFIGNDTLIEEPVNTNFKYLPLVFVSGESVKINEAGKRNQVCRPYVTSAIDAQRAKNFFLSTLVNETENMRQTDIIAAKETLPAEPEYREAWLNPQSTKAALIYNHVSPNEPDKLLPPPQVIPRGQINNSVIQLYDMMDKTLQGTLGSFNTQVGVGAKEISGIAMMESITQSNGSTMPYIVNFLKALQQVSNIVVDLIPKFYTTKRTVPVVGRDGKHTFQEINTNDQNAMKYSVNALDVIVKPGVNFEIQKTRSVETLVSLSQAFPSIGQIVNSNPALIIDNIDIRGKDQLKRDAEKQQQQMQQQQAQQQQQPNPQMIQLQLQQQRMQLQAQKQQQDFQIDQAKIQQAQSQQQIDLIGEQLEAASREKAADAEIIRAKAELDIKRVDTVLKHNQF